MYFYEITDRKATDVTHDRQGRQQTTVADLGDRGLRVHDAIALMDEAVAEVSRTLDVELVAVAERMAGGDRLLLRSGTGWKPGRVGRDRSAGGMASLDGYAIETGEPLLCEDVARETRCRPSPLVVEHDVVSAAVVPIHGRRAPFGALGVFSRRPRQFGETEINFLRAIANVLSSATERARLEQQVREVRDTERRRIARALHHDETLQELIVGRAARGERVRMLLVDDRAAIREALALAFAEDGGFVMAGQAGALAEARMMLAGIDVAIIAVTLPDGHGADLIPELRASSPDAQALVLSTHADRGATANAVEKGATAVLNKASHLPDIVAAVRRIDAGYTLIPRGEMAQPLRFTAWQRDLARDERRLANALTPREREVLQLLADGLDAKRVAARLHITPRTQRNHVANILAKLGVHSQLQALVVALRHGIVALPSAMASPN
jgi:DNA-binding NarL/FixJ family response regulator